MRNGRVCSFFRLPAMLVATVLLATSSDAATRNLILVIGDGMGPQQVGFLELYASEAPGSIYEGRPTSLYTMANAGTMGMSVPVPDGALVIDSACSATQLATGKQTGPERIGVDALGEPLETIVEEARRHGKRTGLVSDTRITHATPAAFASHAAHRTLEPEIAEDLVESGVDVMLSGGLAYFVPNEIRDREAYRRTYGIPSLPSSRRDDATDVLAAAREAGYELAFDRAALLELERIPVLGLFATGAMRDGIRETRAIEGTLDEPDGQPTLAEMTLRALELLDNENGFFLMVEAGRIDWACHDNDAGTLLHEMLRLDRTLKVILEWTKDRDDTLVVVTADHEAGGFGLSYSRYGLPAQAPDAVYWPRYNFGDPATLDRIHAQKRSFPELLAELDAARKPSARMLRELVSDSVEFEFTLTDARNALRSERNRYRVRGHKYLGGERFPAVHDLEAFYVYSDEVRGDLIGRALATEQGVVWATGTHTHTPVPVIAYGPVAATERFGGFYDHAELGRRLRDALLGSR